MPAQTLSAADYAKTVIAVPPIALTDDLQVAEGANRALVRHIVSGGVNILLYGGNANLYNYDLGRYADALAMMEAAADPGTHMVTSIGPDFGKILDEAPLVERSGIRNVMMLPMVFPADPAGVMRGVRVAAERLGFPVVVYVKRENYLAPDMLAELINEGSVAFIKYAVERPDPANDGYLDAILAAVGRENVASGMGETPVADHIGVRKMATFTSGAVCIAPAAAQRFLELTRTGDPEATPLGEPFLAFERIRTRLGGLQVLHQSFRYTDIASMGPQLPLISDIDPAYDAELKASVDILVALEHETRAVPA